MSKETTRQIGERIRRLRDEQILSQSALAGRVGVTPHTVYLWESGRRYPSPENIDAIARALGVSVSALFGGDDSAPSKPPLPPGLQAMLDKDLADPPPTEDEMEELRQIQWRGTPDGVSFLYALQAIRRANR